jgi:hypothetical protein
VSQPKTGAEQEQHDATAAVAGMSENVVSTECPECHVRFAMLAHYGHHDDSGTPGWLLRCTLCGHLTGGELKK